MSRGNGIVSAKRREQARKHASRSFVCLCGKVCHGNGGSSSHKRACALWIAAMDAKMSTQPSTTDKGGDLK